jgi:hypothetical protein
MLATGWLGGEIGAVVAGGVLGAVVGTLGVVATGLVLGVVVVVVGGLTGEPATGSPVVGVRQPAATGVRRAGRWPVVRRLARAAACA